MDAARVLADTPHNKGICSFSFLTLFRSRLVVCYFAASAEPSKVRSWGSRTSVASQFMEFNALEDPRVYVGGDPELYGLPKAGITQIAATHFTTNKYSRLPVQELWC